MRYILASKSPRRKEILGDLGIEFESIPAVGKEKMIGDRPASIVESLSLQKAEEVAERVAGEVIKEETMVIGADTVVAIDDQILGKPKDAEDALHMLQKLQGNVHSVFTGVTLITIGVDGEKKCETFSEETKVHFYPATEEELTDHIANSSEWKDKAGAYAVQGTIGKRFLKKLDGDYYNVVGLPSARLYRILR